MRLIVKVGTNVLTNNSQTLQPAVLKRLVAEIFGLQSAGYEVVLVSSGAVASGRARLAKLESGVAKQILAGVGQPFLMQAYGKYAAEFGAEIGQVLILRSELTDRERYNNLVEVLTGMLRAGVLPVVNGNDVIATADLIVGDNDLLAAMVAVAVGADKLIILTNQAGMFTGNPDTDKDVELITEVKNINHELERLCSRATSSNGRGGMLSKVRAAKHAAAAG
ncbi:MAG: glutamate 5-kinase, partial [Patescibacteria group bacterium]|nr:glutamate 5-kinase [Patescibacteria group bacterium]